MHGVVSGRQRGKKEVKFVVKKWQAKNKNVISVSNVKAPCGDHLTVYSNCRERTQSDCRQWRAAIQYDQLVLLWMVPSTYVCIYNNKKKSINNYAVFIKVLPHGVLPLYAVFPTTFTSQCGN